jgi:hypothetical protein
MKKWKVTIELEGKVLEVITEAKFYSEAYISTELKYPGCIIKSVSEIRTKPL